ncbi:MAG: ATP-binding protein [Rhizomicrobium sp.]
MRALRTSTGLIAFALLLVAFGDVVLHNRFTLMAPGWFAVLVAIVLSFLLHEFVVARQRTEILDRQAAQLKSASGRLEQSLASAAAFNARLNQSEARYKALVDAQGDAIFRRAPDSRLTYGNDAFFKLFGLDPRRAVWCRFRAGTASREPGAPVRQLRRPGDGPRPRALRPACPHRLWLALDRLEDYAVRDAQGRLVEVQSVGRDITERKALEDAIVEARDKAEAGSRAKSGFLATMSHEIRTPMNGVLGMARLLLETELRPEQRTYVEAISQSGEALLTLIGDILDFSKIESGTFSPEDDEVDLRPLIEGVVELSCPRAHDKDIELVAVVDPAVPAVVRSDSVRLRQVLTNLVGNAVKFTERGGVELSVRVVDGPDRRFLRFEVRDTGVGVPKEKRDEIFREFVQADSSHARKFGGSGLGLAISKKLVEAMGGEIGIDEAAGGGSKFWFTLPSVVVKPAPDSQAETLQGITIAIVTRNTMLRDGLAAQVRAVGGAVFNPNDGRRPDFMLIDAGTDSEPSPPGRARPRRAGPRRADAGGALAARCHARHGVRGLSGEAGAPVDPRCAAAPSGGEAPRSALPIHAAPRASFPMTAPARAEAPGAIRILLAEDNPINLMLTRELLRRRGHSVIEVTSGEAGGEGDGDRRIRHRADRHSHARHGRDRGDAGDPRL